MKWPALRYAVTPFFLFICACAQECAPAQVAQGIARLTVQNADALATALDADDTCGFSAMAVMGAAEITGNPGEQGTMVLTVEECALDFGEEGWRTEPDCYGYTTTSYQAATVSGTKTIKGYITGDPMRPIIPAGFDAVTIELSATFDGYHSRSSDPEKDTYLVWKDGTLSGAMTPFLALSGETGLCTIRTDHTRFWDVIYGPSNVVIKKNDGGKLAVPVDSSNLSGMYGKGVANDDENLLTGMVSVWGGEETIPIDGDEDGLDPDYTLELFNGAFVCDDVNPDLADPLAFACPSMESVLADNAARLSVSTFATVAGMVAANDSCGFASMGVVGTEVVAGVVNTPGSVTRTVSGCVMDIPADLALSPNCYGSATTVVGKVTVSGTQVFTGIITGNPMAPVNPMADNPVVMDLTLTFENFSVTSGGNTLTNASGTLAGRLTPRMAMDTSAACSVMTSIAKLEDMVYTDGVMEVVSGGTSYTVTIEDSDFDAGAGNWGTDAINTLAGTVTINEEDHTVPANSAGLDPAYDEAAFNGSWSCNPSLVQPVSHDCAPTNPLAQAAARALMKAVGVATGLVNADSTCGFAAPATMAAGSADCTPPCQGVMTWSTTDCAVLNLAAGSEVPASTNCLDPAVTTYVSGEVTASSTMTLTGQLTGSNPPAVPMTRDAAEVEHTALVLNNFTVYDLVGAATEADLEVSFSGTITGTVGPIAGESDSNAGVYSVATPVSRLTDIQVTGGSVTLTRDGAPTTITIADADLDAFAGAYGDDVNSIGGTITLTVPGMGDVPVTLPVPTLDPGYDQTAFDASYSCTPDLKETVPVN